MRTSAFALLAASLCNLALLGDHDSLYASLRELGDVHALSVAAEAEVSALLSNVWGELPTWAYTPKPPERPPEHWK